MNPWIALGLVLAWVASLAGVGYWQNDAGHTAERVAWQTRDNEELRKANAKIIALNDAARQTEQQNAAKVAAIATDYERKLKDAKTQRDHDIADAYSGAIGLRIPSTSGITAGGSEAATTTAATGQCNGGTATELPRETVANLLALADDADEITNQLAACQEVIRADRE